MPTLDVSTDYLLFDNEESIQYQVKLGEGQFADPVTINFCLRRQQGQAFDDYSQVNSLSWTLPKDECGNIVPKKGDIFTAPKDNTTWIIGDTDFATWVTRYRVPTQKFIQ